MYFTSDWTADRQDNIGSGERSADSGSSEFGNKGAPPPDGDGDADEPGAGTEGDAGEA
jgi:hypothetical protein